MDNSHTLYTYGVDTGSVDTQTITTYGTTTSASNAYITLSGTMTPLSWFFTTEIKFGFNLKFKVSKAKINKSWEFDLGTSIISTKLKKLI